MNIYEFGNKENPIIMLFPGTMCYWKGNRKTVREVFVSAVAYTGFDEFDAEAF